MSKKSAGFSISAKDITEPIRSGFDWGKEKEKTEQEKEKAKAKIHESDNVLKAAQLSSQREYERNYTEMIRILTEHERGCKDTHVRGMIEIIQRYADIVMGDQNEEIKKRCLDTMDNLSFRIESLGNGTLSRSTANWLDSIRKLPEA